MNCKWRQTGLHKVYIKQQYYGKSNDEPHEMKSALEIK